MKKQEVIRVICVYSKRANELQEQLKKHEFGSRSYSIARVNLNFYTERLIKLHLQLDQINKHQSRNQRRQALLDSMCGQEREIV